MKDILYLLRRCKNVTKRSVTGKGRLAAVLFLMLSYALSGGFSNFVYELLSKQIFEFRIREMTNIQKLSVRVSAADIEQKGEEQNIIKA